MQRHLAHLSPKYKKKQTISYQKLKQRTYCRQNARKQQFTYSCMRPSFTPCLNIRCSCVFCPTTSRLLSRPFKVSSRFSIALLTVFRALYISVFDMIIAVLIAGIVLLQKAKYLHEVYFHDIDSAPYFRSQ